MPFSFPVKDSPSHHASAHDLLFGVSFAHQRTSLVFTSSSPASRAAMDATPEEVSEDAGKNVDAVESATPRRSFLSVVSSAVMAFGITVGYGTFAWLLGRFMYPFRGNGHSWQFLADLDSFHVGNSMTYIAPAGQKVVVSRLAEEGVTEDFIALSSVCPHLGCQVHWQGAENRFFCPCHNGAFSATGDPLSGPPKDAGQTLPRYPLKIEGSLLFIQVPTEALV